MNIRGNFSLPPWREKMSKFKVWVWKACIIPHLEHLENHPNRPYTENAPFGFGQSNKRAASAESTAMADLSLSSQNCKANGYR